MNLTKSYTQCRVSSIHSSINIVIKICKIPMLFWNYQFIDKIPDPVPDFISILVKINDFFGRI